MLLKDKLLGCLVGGAIGDSFGYPIENMDWPEIEQKYNGMYDFNDYEKSGKLISDDTQMTLFTLEALSMADSDNFMQTIYESYQRWFDTQFGPGAIDENIASKGALHQDKRMFAIRMPGHACMDAMRKGIIGTPQKPINLSKGNGAVMRAAPFGFFIDQEPTDVYTVSYLAAALTHGSEEAQQCAGAFSLLIYYLLKGDKIWWAISDTQHILENLGQKIAYEAIQKACLISNKWGRPALEDLDQMGEGWTAAEALELAIFFLTSRWYKKIDTRFMYCANRTGDSDTIASMLGNLWGAFWGIHAFDNITYKNIECLDLLPETLDSFYQKYSISLPESVPDPVPYA